MTEKSRRGMYQVPTLSLAHSTQISSSNFTKAFNSKAEMSGDSLQNNDLDDSTGNHEQTSYYMKRAC